MAKLLVIDHTDDLVKALRSKGLRENDFEPIKKPTSEKMDNIEILACHLGGNEDADKLKNIICSLEKTPKHRLLVSDNSALRQYCERLSINSEKLFKSTMSFSDFDSKVIFPCTLDSLKSILEGEKILNEAKYIRCEILNPLLPLHFSLQAFFGISRDEKGEFVKVGEREIYAETRNRNPQNWEIRDKLRDDNTGILEDFRKSFPNFDAFLLVKEVEWDFYASIFDRLMPEDKYGGMKGDCTGTDEERAEYDPEKNIVKLLGRLLENKKNNKNYENLEVLRKTLNKDYTKEQIEGFSTFFKLNLKSDSKKVSYGEFVKCLRELCAILANPLPYSNPIDFGDEKGIFIYKGKCQRVRNEILDHIKDTRGNKLDTTPHCKMTGKSKMECSDYDILVKQIANWGIEKTMIVIAGIEKLAEFLD